MTKYIICDIDGTICDSSHRRPDELDKVKDDKVIDWVYEALEDKFHRYHSINNPVKIIFITGRTEDSREVTSKWLESLGLPSTYLNMKQSEHLGLAYWETKLLLLKDALEFYIDNKKDILCVFENDPACVRMYRGLGLKVFDVGGK